MDKKFLLGTVAILAILASGSAKALPVSDNVVAGVVAIEETLGNTNIHQNSDKAIIDWKNFDVALDEHVQFYHPSSSSITLNRIHDTKASLIEGTLTANGHIMLMNQNGLMFGSGAVVDVGSLTVTTADIDNADFMAGNYQFFSGSNDQARIVNDGSISVKDAGLVNLVAPHVENNGLIYAKMGKIQMAAADAFTLDLAGDGLIHIELSESDTQKLVRNNGKLQADGGYIAMTASKARNIVDSLVDSSGVIEATSMTSVGGKIVLSSDGGLTKVSGKIDASGKDGGGEIFIGGDYQGQGNIVTSSKTEITKTAELSANAIEKGDGGKVIVWADDSTVFAGAISVDAASVGDGGFVETSGKDTLNVKESAFVSASAAGDGLAGAWLLDPRNVILSSAAGTDASAGGTIDATTDDEIIQISTIETALNNGINTIITTGSTGAQDGDITLQDALSWSGTGSLTLDAANDIILNNTITSTDQNADLTLNAGNDVFVNNTIDTFDDLVMASYGAYADLTINAGNDVNINGVLDLYGDLNVTATAGTINIGTDIDTNSGDITLNSQTVFTSNATIYLYDHTRVKVNASGGSASEYYSQYGALNTPSAGMDIGTNTVSFKAGGYNIMGNILGVGGTLRLYNVASNSRRMSLGDGMTPLSNHISSAELDFIQPGFGEIIFDAAAIGGRSWNNTIQFYGNVQKMDFYGVHDF